ncbi:MAG: divergent PAP2 family protein [Candidatus Omnitrophica bacterium]|nr:divergent PAP2 family protein [Candidatus Omnitrophota bacterium]
MREYIITSPYNILLTTLIAWFLAQTIKVFLGVLKEKRFNFKWFVGTGGMPSSHAAIVSAMTTVVGIKTGVDSVYFAIALLFAVVVLFDAQGVRRSSGQQAEILNKILDDIYWKKRIKEDRLKELLGHTPIEVLAGMFIGITIAFYLGPR